MQGLQIYDAEGDLTLDVSDRITKILGELVIPNTVEKDSGTLEVPELANGGTPFYFSLGNEAQKSGYRDPKGWSHGFWIRDDGSYYPAYEIPAYKVQVSFSGTTMSWSVEKYSRWWVGIKNSSFRILYGVY